jgi:hypothetical protein
VSSVSRLRRRLSALDREEWLAVGVATLSGAVVFFVALVVFPYHSANHDEGVYLLQAAMLLEGQLELQAGALADAFRPWFFIEDGGRLYSKYTPVPAAMYAVSMALFGEPRVTLAVVAAGSTGLVYWLGAMTVDRRVGVVAAALFATAPMTLFTSSVFLPLRADDVPQPRVRGCLSPRRPHGVDAGGSGCGDRHRAGVFRPALHCRAVRRAVYLPCAVDGRAVAPSRRSSDGLHRPTIRLAPEPGSAQHADCAGRARLRRADAGLQPPAHRLAARVPLSGVRPA